LWDECNRILDQQEKTNKRPTKKAVHLFTGIVHCGCGIKMYVPSGSKKYVCLSCRKNRIATEDLEEIYYENLKSFLLTKDHLETFLLKSSEKIQEKKQELKTLKTEKKRLESEMDKLVDLRLSDEIPKEGFNRRYNPLNEQLAQIENSIPEIEAEIDFLKIEQLNSDVILQEAQNLYDRWPSLQLEDKRQIVEQITDKITIDNDEIRFAFSYNPTPPTLIPSNSTNDPDSQRNLMGSYWLST
jgi:site-specific DNA recombinase